MNDQTLTSSLPFNEKGQSEPVSKALTDKERNAQLEGAIKDMESFSFSVSHDLRSSIRSINGFAKMLAEDKAESLDEEGKEYLNIIRKSALRMDKLIDDLLRLSKYNTRPMLREKVNVNGIIAQAMRGIRYEGEMNLSNLKTAYADSDLLKQVWTNLISNAVKFTGNKSLPVIEIGLKRVDGENVYYIKDNGAGFDMKYAGRLFGIFQRMHNEREFPGAGVGLAIVHRIIARHGGRIWAEAGVDKGATFYFTLPTA